MEQIQLKATVRKITGNGPARALRREGSMPAVVYGRGKDPILLSVDIKDFEQLLKNYNINQVLLNLMIENGKSISKSVMVKELQTDPITRNLLHVDFYEIDMQNKITVSVPVVTTGISKGVELGGVLQLIRRELEVLCMPTDIPESIEIDVTDLDIGDSIHVEEVPLKGDIEIPFDANFTILTVLSPRVEEEPEVEEEEEVEGEEGAEEEAAPEEGEEE